MPVLADQDQFPLGIHRDYGDAGPVIDPALPATPTVGEKDVALEDIEDAATIDEIPDRFIGIGHGFIKGRLRSATRVSPA
jgi:hypothetical protein